MAFPPSKIEPYANLLGKVPDKRIAEMAGVAETTVAAFRRKKGIAVAGDDAAPVAPAPAEVSPAPVAPAGAEPVEAPAKVSSPAVVDASPRDRDDASPLEHGRASAPSPDAPPKSLRVKYTVRVMDHGVERFIPRSIFDGDMAAKMWELVPHDAIEVLEP
jgi:hypothetical protein